jgi:hypothetical protein
MARITSALLRLREQVTEALGYDRPWTGKARGLQAGLRGKFERLVPDEVARTLDRPWGKDLDTFVNHHLDDPIVEALLLPTADLRFFLARLAGRTRTNIVFGSPTGPGIECYRGASTLLINESGQARETVSWSRRLSISKSTGKNPYKKHLHEPRYNGREAKYNADVVPALVESAAVKNGLGYGRADRLFFFGRFASPVGQTGRGGGRSETHYLKVQLDRVARETTPRLLKSGRTSRHLQGMEIHMHGYPISEQELRDDFPIGAAAVMSLAIAT